MPPQFTCIICQNQPTDTKKPEHILLNALGGKMRSKTALCASCNNWLGAGPDKELADSVATLRNFAALKSGDGRPPPVLQYVDDENFRYSLHEGRRIVTRPATPWQEDTGGVRLTAANEQGLQKLLEGLGQKNDLNQEQQKVLVENALSEAVVFERPAPSVKKKLSLGSIGAQRSMLKACLVLWEKAVGNNELQHDRYDAARRFVVSEAKASQENLKQVVRLSTKPIANLPEKFSKHPCIVWAGSNSSGRALGYFNLYGVAGWAYELCRNGAPADRSITLVSNPFKNSIWERFDNVDVANIKVDWVEHLASAKLSSLPDMEAALSTFMKSAHQVALEDTQLKMIEEVADYVGLKDGELIEGEKGHAFISEVARRFTNQMLGVPDQRPLKPRNKT